MQIKHIMLPSMHLEQRGLEKHRWETKSHFVHNCRLIHFWQSSSWQRQHWPPVTAYVTQQNEQTSIAVPQEQEQGQIVAVNCREEQQDLTENHCSGTCSPVSLSSPVYCSVMSHSCTAYLSCAKWQREHWMPAQSNQGPLERSWMRLVEEGRNVVQWERRISLCLDK